jgi:predicted RecA/RadA family phage recombinase
MKNFIMSSAMLTLIAPYALASGAGFQVGSIFAVASADAANGAEVVGATEGVFALAKTSAQAWTVGQKVYWDDVNKRCDTDGTVGMLIGTAHAAAANPSDIGEVILNGTAPSGSEGPQDPIADITTADAVDAATAATLANATKATVNTILAELRLAGVIKP